VADVEAGGSCLATPRRAAEEAVRHALERRRADDLDASDGDQPRLRETCSYVSRLSLGAAAMRSSSARISAARTGSVRRQRPSGGTKRAAVCGLIGSSARIRSAIRR
jgi:hypothetical protein